MTVHRTDLEVMTKEELLAELLDLHAQRDAGAADWQPLAEVAGAESEQAAPVVSADREELGAERAKRMEAERVGRIKDEFLANLSHELRTPLSAILGWSHVLKQGNATADERAEGLEVIERNARVQARLIDDMLDMSRIITGKLRLDVQRVDLPTVIGFAVEAVRLAAEAKGVRLGIIVDPIAGPVTGDPNRLQQVVSNLLSNAIKFTPRSGKVQVTLERVNSHVELSVSDTGMGIAPDFLPYIFEKFSQGESGLTKNNTGLGLGLAIVKHLIELHGGTVRAKSAGPGKGSTFIVSLPVSIVRSHNGNEHGRHPETPTNIEFSADPDLDGVRVLVVDDDADASVLVEHILGKCKAIVATCQSAGECLEALPRVKPHVLLTDIGMSEIDGYSLMKQVRRLPPEEGGATPTAALTAFARSEDRRQALLAGFDMHVAKPVEPGELVAVVARLARRV